MDNQQTLNELEARQLELQSRMMESDRAALDYVKTLPGFAEAYPEFAEANAQTKEEMETTNADLVNIKAEWEFHIGEFVEAGQEIIRNGQTYVVLQSHTLQADWLPESTPSLYKLKAEGEWPEWVQPTGAHDAYNKGDKVTFEGDHYISLIDGNVWSPAVYPAGWEKQA